MRLRRMSVWWRKPGSGAVRAAFAASVLLAVSACQPPTGTATVPAAAPLLPQVSADGVGYLVFNTAISPNSRDLFIQDMDKLRAAGAREIHLGINSPGGEINSARAMVAYLNRLHQDGITVQVYNLGRVASAASYLFLSGQGRYTVPQGQFVFHAPFAAGLVVANAEQLRDDAADLEAFESTMHDLLRQRTRLTDAEAQTYVHRTVVLSADDARRDGVVDAVLPFNVPKGVGIWAISPRPPVTRPATAAAAPALPPTP